METKAFSVEKVKGGFVAYELLISEKGRVLSKMALCTPCHKSLAYQYMIAHVNRQLVEGMIEDANRKPEAK